MPISKLHLAPILRMREQMGDKRKPLTRRWFKMARHDGQLRYGRSRVRFNIAACGRRSGKTEKAKRKLAAAALNAHMPQSRFYCPQQDPRFFAAAPTRDQAKDIYWEDLKMLIPKHTLLRSPNESELRIQIVNGAEIRVIGMDRPQRMEGHPWNGGVLDEYADMRKEVWSMHVRPMLADRRGWCDFIGVPNGRNHYYQLWKEAEIRETEEGESCEWMRHHWTSAEVLPLYGRGEEIELARRDMDELSFKQEFEASFLSFTGRAYWPWDELRHCGRLKYDQDQPLIFMFDFNVAPGVAAVAQEQELPSGCFGTGIIGEVWIPRGSNTPMVVNKLLSDWPDHNGKIFAYGDATGGRAGTAQTEGSDWYMIRRMLFQHYGSSRVFLKVPKVNPHPRDRVNSVNSRLKSLGGDVRLMVDPSRAPNVVKDFEEVVVVEGGSGEIDKKGNPDRTHLTDAIGYFVHREYPLKQIFVPSGERYWR